MNLDEREKYENWFRATYGKAPMPRTSPAYDFCWAGYKAGAASRDAEVVSLMNQRDYEYVRAENAEQERDQFEQERDQLRKELDIEQMRLVACDVIAMADTKTSAIEARKMHPDYRSPACESVERRVDECITLREQVKMMHKTLSGLVKAIDAAEYSTQFQMNLRIAEEALAATEQNP